ncbi:hypothetical protein PJKIFABJ_00006 [Pseudomonas phage PE09]|uniref:Uncharacterized protein n=2 Tax=Otagovirus TaxID=2560197 RepID=A0A7S8BBH5_9CAUD|nr:hypothetical protein QGX22_gp006 [Pseudomonas phage PE09]YP_010768313.1 hypothetical protein QGX23_gp005 [Pseudomonas phage PN09]QHZ59961.1 hypothetical protein PJKIFABJ_00006 [Pseudomonas phage PE09]QPB10426.1 hypothetical protein PN09_005 [Pseudomonas phage PN09]
MIIMAPDAIKNLVERIREWEMDAGESFTDYFFDRYSYGTEWNDFLDSKGFHAIVEEIKADRYVLSSGHVLTCTDQQLKFEPYNSAWEACGNDWSEDEYRKDVALWAEFILADEELLEECNAFLNGEDE